MFNKLKYLGRVIAAALFAVSWRNIKRDSYIKQGGNYHASVTLLDFTNCWRANILRTQ
jgi:hypothetical protein